MYTVTDIQTLLDKAVRLATYNAVRGQPLTRVIWIPPETASSDLTGNLIPQFEPPRSGSEKYSWE